LGQFGDAVEDVVGISIGAVLDAVNLVGDAQQVASGVVAVVEQDVGNASGAEVID
jgi:hypothetical protein